MSGDDTNAVVESFMQLHIDRILDESIFATLEEEIRRVIRYVNLVCDDWEPMKAACVRLMNNSEIRSLVILKPQSPVISSTGCNASILRLPAIAK